MTPDNKNKNIDDEIQVRVVLPASWPAVYARVHAGSTSAAQLLERCGVPRGADVFITSGGRSIDPAWSLAASGVSADATIIVSVRARGGAPTAAVARAAAAATARADQQRGAFNAVSLSNADAWWYHSLSLLQLEHDRRSLKVGSELRALISVLAANGGNTTLHEVIITLAGTGSEFSTRHHPSLSAAVAGTHNIKLQQFSATVFEPCLSRPLASWPAFPEDPSNTIQGDIMSVMLRSIELLPQLPAAVGVTSGFAKPRPLWTSEAQSPQHISNIIDDYGQRIPVLRRCEDTYMTVFRPLVAALRVAYAKASDAGDGRGMQNAVYDILTFPRRYLRRLVGQAPSRARKAFARDQLVGGLLVTQTELERSTSKREDESFDTVCARSAFRCVTEGFVGKGAKQLVRDQVADVPQAKKEADLFKLHPDGKDPDVVLPQLGFFTALFDVDDVRAHVHRRIPAGSAPGPSGWTEEMLDDALVDDNFAHGFMVLLRDICNGRVSAGSARVLSASALVGIPKPDGGTRPIALGEVFLKTADAFALKAAKPRLQRIFGDLQLGCNVSGGAERIVHTVRRFVREAPPGSKRVIATFDLTNAFNTPARRAMWEAVKDIPELVGIFSVSYAHAAPLFVVGSKTVIMSKSGSRQGTNAGGAFFSLTMQPALEIADQVPDTTPLAFYDDTTIMGESMEATEKAARLFHAACEARGLYLNPKKCEVFALNGDAPPAGSMLAQFSQKRVLKILGAQIAATDAEEAAALMKREGPRHTNFCRRVALLCVAQGMLLLQKCGVPKLSYIGRVQGPAVCQQLNRTFDAIVEQVACGWAGVNADDAVRLVLALPVKEGGFGLPRHELISAAAYEASIRKALFPADTAPSQRELARKIMDVFRDAVVNTNPRLQRQLQVNSLEGAAAFLSNISVRALPDIFAAAMRLRLGAATPEIVARASIPCPACKGATMLPHEWCQHVASCAKLSQCNAGTRHNTVVAFIRCLMRLCGMWVRADEPRDLKVHSCSCGVELTMQLFHEHRKSCHLPVARRDTSGPDIAYLDPVTKLDMAADLTIRAFLAPSYLKQPVEDGFAQMRATKTAKYGALCADANFVLITFAAASNGHLDATFARAIASFATHGQLNVGATLRDLATTIALLSGKSLLRAERQLCAAPSSKAVGALEFATKHARTGFDFVQRNTTRAVSVSLAPVDIVARMRDVLPAAVRSELQSPAPERASRAPSVAAAEQTIARVNAEASRATAAATAALANARGRAAAAQQNAAQLEMQAAEEKQRVQQRNATEFAARTARLQNDARLHEIEQQTQIACAAEAAALARVNAAARSKSKAAAAAATYAQECQRVASSVVFSPTAQLGQVGSDAFAAAPDAAANAHGGGGAAAAPFDFFKPHRQPMQPAPNFVAAHPQQQSPSPRGGGSSLRCSASPQARDPSGGDRARAIERTIAAGLLDQYAKTNNRFEALAAGRLLTLCYAAHTCGDIDPPIDITSLLQECIDTDKAHHMPDDAIYLALEAAEQLGVIVATDDNGFWLGTTNNHQTQRVMSTKLGMIKSHIQNTTTKTDPAGYVLSKSLSDIRATHAHHRKQQQQQHTPQQQQPQQQQQHQQHQQQQQQQQQHTPQHLQQQQEEEEQEQQQLPARGRSVAVARHHQRQQVEQEKQRQNSRQQNRMARSQRSQQ